MTPEQQALVEASQDVWGVLDAYAVASRDMTVQAACHWIVNNGAGLPSVPFMEEEVRQQAVTWAGMATPPEIEAYLVAALVQMENNIVLQAKAAKRLGALAYRKMQPADRIKFKQWIEGQENGASK